MKINELFLKTLFCCSACDGDIAPEEISLVKEIISKNTLFEDINIEETLNGYVEEINQKGTEFLKEFLSELSTLNISEEDQLTLVNLAIKMIEADNQILYSEVKFFKKIRKNLSISDEKILMAFPEAEDYLLPDIIRDDKEEEWNNIVFAPINL